MDKDTAQIAGIPPITPSDAHNTEPSADATTGYKASSTDLPQPTVTAPSERSPLTDSRVSWIYDFNKKDLKTEMIKYGLDVSGNTETLRKRFAEFWRNESTKLQLTSSLSIPASRPTTLATGGRQTIEGAAEANAYEHRADEFADLALESVSIREILGLSPNADSTTVRRTLTSVLRPSGYGADAAAYPLPRRDTTLDPTHAATKMTFSHGGPTMTIPTLTSADRHGDGRPGGAPRDFDFLDVDAYRPVRDQASLCQAVRKWNVKFDGRRDPVSFLERLEELMDAYGTRRDDIVKALPELLTGQALLWYRNNKPLLTDYVSFRRQFDLQFLPPGYHRNLDDEIRSRTQGEKESFRDFVTAITTLIRRSGAYSRQNQLDIIFRNMRPEYQLMVRRRDCTSLAEMTERAEDYESYVRDKKNFRPPPSPHVTLVPETAYKARPAYSRNLDSAVVETQNLEPPGRGDHDRPRKPREGCGGPKTDISRPQAAKTNQRPGQTVLCWNCEKTGHYARDCRQPRVVRCVFCKTRGLLTGQCDCRQGNGKPAQA